MSQYIFWISVFAFYIMIALYWAYGFYKGAPYYPSNKKAVKQMLAALDLKPGMKVAELGSGDGRIAIALAKQGASVTALDVNPMLTLITRVKVFIRRLKNVEVLNKDVLKHNYSDYDAVVIYLYPALMAKLENKLWDELPKGATIISNTFSFKKHEPVEIINDRIKIYKTD